MKAIVAAFLLSAGLLVTASFAQDEPPPGLEDLDTDQSGDLTLAELLAQYPKMTQERFDGSDVDKDGKLNIEELKTLRVLETL